MMCHILPLSSTTIHCIIPLQLVHFQVHINQETILAFLAVQILHLYPNSHISMPQVLFFNLQMLLCLEHLLCLVLHARVPISTGKNYFTRHTHSLSMKFLQEEKIGRVILCIPSERILWPSQSFRITAEDLQTRTMGHAHPVRPLIPLWR
jgi:hypothetical protein